MFRIVLCLPGFQVRHYDDRKGVVTSFQFCPTVTVIGQLYSGEVEVDLTPPEFVTELARSPRVIVIGQHSKARDEEIVPIKQTMVIGVDTAVEVRFGLPLHLHMGQHPP